MNAEGKKKRALLGGQRGPISIIDFSYVPEAYLVVLFSMMKETGAILNYFLLTLSDYLNFRTSLMRNNSHIVPMVIM